MVLEIFKDLLCTWRMRISINLSFKAVSQVYDCFFPKPKIVILKPRIVIDKLRIMSYYPLYAVTHPNYTDEIANSVCHNQTAPN